MNKYINLVAEYKDTALDLALFIVSIPLFITVMGYIFSEVALMTATDTHIGV